MLGLNDLNALLGAASDTSTDEDSLIAYATKLGSVGGLSVMLCRPGSKLPWDTRTPAMRKSDAETWETLPEHLRPPSPEGMKGLHIATSASSRIRALIRAAYKKGEGMPNLAINVGRSRLVVIDVDTPEEVKSFRDWAAAHATSPEEATMWQRLVPTVESPGTKDDQGQWQHHGGGHFWIQLTPEDFDRVPFADLPSDLTINYGNSHFSMFLGSRYVLVPPSRRAEGAYRARGPVTAAPPWLVDYLINVAEERSRTLSRQVSHGLDEEAADELQSWYDAHPWSEFLTDLNYSLSGTDSCGCPIWQRPGGSSYKSVTAHERSCTSPYYGASEDPPLVIWTDNPGPELESARALTRSKSRAVSKAQVAAAMHHEGDMAATFTAILGASLSGIAHANVHYPAGISIVGFDDVEYPGSVPEPTKAPWVVDPTWRSPRQLGNLPNLATPEMSAGTGQWDPIPSASPLSVEMTPQPASPTSEPDYPHPPMGQFNPYQQQTFPQPNQAPDPGSAGQQDYASATPVPALQQNREYSTPGDSGSDEAGDDSTEALDADYASASLADDYAGQAGYDVGHLKYEAKEVRTAPDIVDIDDVINRPRDIYLVDGLLQRSGRNAVVGPSNVGKSALVMDMLCALTADPVMPGANFGLWHQRRVMHARVLYVAGEGARGAADRVATWRREHGRNIRGERFKMMTRPVNFGDAPYAWYDLEKKARAFFTERHNDPYSNLGADTPVLVFDTLATMLADVEENSATDMGAVMNRLETLRAELDCTIILVHHTGKGENADVMRGSSAIMGALDSVLMLSPVDMEPLEFSEPDIFAAFDTGDNGVNKSHTPIKLINVRVDKQRNFAYDEPFQMSLVAVPVRNPDGSFARSQWSSPADPTPSQKPPTAVIIGDRRGVVPEPKKGPVDLTVTADYKVPERVAVKPDIEELTRDVVRRVAEMTTSLNPQTPTSPPASIAESSLRKYISSSRGKYRISATAKESRIATLVEDAINTCIDARVLTRPSSGQVALTADHVTRRDREKATAAMLDRLDKHIGGAG